MIYVNNAEYIMKKVNEIKIDELKEKYTFYVNILFFLFVAIIGEIASILSKSNYKMLVFIIILLLLLANIKLAIDNRIIISNDVLVQNKNKINLKEVYELKLEKRIIMKNKYEVVLVLYTEYQNEKKENILRLKNIMNFYKMIKIIERITGKGVIIEN